jgi:hypothetical protein
MPYVLQFSGKEINGNSHAQFYAPLRALAVREGFECSEVSGIIKVGQLDALGVTDFRSKSIKISDALPPNMKVRVLAHELGHALVGIPDVVWPGRSYATLSVISETVAESISLRVCHGIGLQVLDVSSNYLNVFDRFVVAQTLEAERQRIHRIADRIVTEISSVLN